MQGRASFYSLGQADFTVFTDYCFHKPPTMLKKQLVSPTLRYLTSARMFFTWSSASTSTLLRLHLAAHRSCPFYVCKDCAGFLSRPYNHARTEYLHWLLENSPAAITAQFLLRSLAEPQCTRNAKTANLAHFVTRSFSSFFSMFSRNTLCLEVNRH